MKNPAAFISYARRDDAAYGRRITGLRERLQRMVAAAIDRVVSRSWWKLGGAAPRAWWTGSGGEVKVGG
jgi:hypothetical protein